MSRPRIIKIAKPVNTYKEIKLYDYQVEQYEKMKRELEKRHFFIDRSKTGAGKTFVTSRFAIDKNYPVLVVCPNIAASKWEEMRDIYGVKVVDIITYGGLRSVNGRQPKHGLLTRIDSNEGTTFEPTDKLIKLVNDGIFVIFDEAQYNRNKGNILYVAVETIINCIFDDPNGVSRAFFFSATPYNKPEHVINFLRLVRINNRSKLYVFNKDEARLVLYGAQDIIDYAMDLDREATLECLERNPITHRNIQEVCYKIFVDVINHHISAGMSVTDHEIPARYGYYELSDENKVALEVGISRLHSAARYNSSTMQSDMKEANWSGITSALHAIEVAKSEIYINKAIEVLESDPNAKVGIGLFYKDTIKLVMDGLANYNPLLIDGSITMKKRGEIIKLFQKPDTEYRVFVCNMVAACTAIDLDDKYGTFPRYVFATPSYRIDVMTQFKGRWWRADSRSEPKVVFVYGKCGKEEASIINSLVNKSTVYKETLPEQVDAGAVFPDSYEKYIENKEDEPVSGSSRSTPPASRSTPPASRSTPPASRSTPPRIPISMTTRQPAPPPSRVTPSSSVRNTPIPTVGAGYNSEEASTRIITRRIPLPVSVKDGSLTQVSRK